MAIVQDQLSDLERAQQEGISLAWLDQLKEKVGGLSGSDENEVSSNLTSRPRGSTPRIGIPQVVAYIFRTKKEVWAHNLTKLYQEGVSRQWSSATDTRWETLKPLPDDVEAAECQGGSFPLWHQSTHGN